MTQYPQARTYRFAGPVYSGVFRVTDPRAAEPSGSPKYPWLVTRDALSRVLVNEAGFTGCGQVGGGEGIRGGITCGQHPRPIVSP